jgi:hypothetical protein
MKSSKDEASKLTKQYVSDLDALRIVLSDKEKDLARLKKRVSGLNQQLEEKEQELSSVLQTKDEKHSQLKEVQLSLRMISEENVILHRHIAELRRHIFIPEGSKTDSIAELRTADAFEMSLEGKLEELDLMLEGLTDLVSLSKKLTTQVKHSAEGQSDDLLTTIENDCVEFMRVNSKLISYLQNIGVGLRTIYNQLELPKVSSKQRTYTRGMQTSEGSENQYSDFQTVYKVENKEAYHSFHSSVQSNNVVRMESSNSREKKTRPLESRALERPKFAPHSSQKQNKHRDTPDRFERIQAELDAISERLTKCTSEQKLLSQVMNKSNN